MPISSRALCLHHNFAADINVARIEDVGRFSAEVTVKCVDCGEPFRFVGVPAGFSFMEPRTSIDGKELRAPIEPIGDAVILARQALYETAPKRPKGKVQ